MVLAQGKIIIPHRLLKLMPHPCIWKIRSSWDAFPELGSFPAARRTSLLRIPAGILINSRRVQSAGPSRPMLTTLQVIALFLLS